MKQFRKGARVNIIAGRWKGRPALVVGRNRLGPGFENCVSLSLLDSDWDSPIVATQAENLELQAAGK